MDNNFFDALEKRQKLVDSICRIADHYGFDKQLEKIQEEIGELIAAISRLRASTDASGCISEDSKEWANFIEELADVQIMVYQMIYLSDADEMFNAFLNNKIYRQLARIKSEEDKGECGHA